MHHATKVKKIYKSV